MKRFKRIYIEITNICNLSCEFCPKTKRQLSFMNLASFEHILKEVQPYSDYIYYHILGEPLLHPDLRQFLALSSTYNYKVNLTTNGTLISNQSDTLLASTALRQINFSLHSFDANIHKLSFKDYMDNILNFIDTARLNTNIIFALRLWNLLLSEHAFTPTVNTIDLERNDQVLSSIEKQFNLNYSLKEKLKENNKLKLADKVYINMASRFQWPDQSEGESDTNGFCHGLRDQIGILVDGTVVPCCLDGEGTINLGNILTTPFSEIINGDRATNIYNGFTNRKIAENLCKKCDYRRRFNK
jgi:radical SAM protein with 4Fe4S-binding SPASM domain